jgi:DNA-binding beta-propeller fold protein YncE
MRNAALVALGAIALLAAPASAKDVAPLPLTRVADIPLAGKPTRLDYQSLDPKTHLLFVAHLGDGVVHVIDVAAGKVVADVADVASVHGVLAVPQLGRCYATATGTKEVVAIDEKTLKVVARIPASGYPDGLAYEPGTGKLYISDEEAGNEVVIDARENRRVGVVPLGGEAGNTQYDAASKHIFVNVQTTGELVEIDPATDKVASRTKLEGADGNHGLFIDAPRRLALAACEGNSTLLVIDMTTMKVTRSFPVGKGVDVLAFDPEKRWLYASSESGTISIFELGSKDEPAARTVRKAFEGFLAPNAHTVAVDPVTHRVYFPLKSVEGKPVLRVMATAAGE